MAWRHLVPFIFGVGLGLWMILRRDWHARKYVGWAMGRQGFFGTMFPDIERRADYERSARIIYAIAGAWAIFVGFFYLFR